MILRKTPKDPRGSTWEILSFPFLAPQRGLFPGPSYHPPTAAEPGAPTSAAPSAAPASFKASFSLPIKSTLPEDHQLQRSWNELPLPLPTAKFSQRRVPRSSSHGPQAFVHQNPPSLQSDPPLRPPSTEAILNPPWASFVTFLPCDASFFLATRRS